MYVLLHCLFLFICFFAFVKNIFCEFCGFVCFIDLKISNSVYILRQDPVY